MSKRVEHTNQIREIAVKLVCDEGKSQTEVSNLLKIPRSTLSDIIKKYKEKGTFKKDKKGGVRGQKFTETVKERLHEIIEDNCTITIEGIIDKLEINVCQSTIWKWLKKIRISYKMTRPIPKSRNCIEVKAERVDYANWYTNIPISIRYRNLIFVDESPFTLHMIRSHGRSRVGTTPNPILTNSRGRNISMILAINSINVILCEAIECNVDGDIFQQFLKKIYEILGDDNFIIVMDNVRFHHSNPEFYDEYDYEIRYLPRYSPFLNPCEEVFSKIKSLVRKDGPLNGTIDLKERMQIASNSITENDLKGYFQHCESFLGKCHTNQDIGRE